MAASSNFFGESNFGVSVSRSCMENATSEQTLVNEVITDKIPSNDKPKQDDLMIKNYKEEIERLNQELIEARETITRLKKVENHEKET